MNRLLLPVIASSLVAGCADADETALLESLRGATERALDGDSAAVATLATANGPEHLRLLRDEAPLVARAILDGDGKVERVVVSGESASLALRLTYCGRDEGFGGLFLRRDSVWKVADLPLPDRDLVDDRPVERTCEDVHRSDR